MSNGERFAVAGYDLLAVAFSARGGGPPETDEFIVLNNNSTHFLVARREHNAPSAILVESYRYGVSDSESEPKDEEEDCAEKYSRALFRMYQEAVRH